MDPVLGSAGLKPRRIWIVGEGASRETLKELWFRKNLPLAGHAVQSLEDFARSLVTAHGFRTEPYPPSLVREVIKKLLRKEASAYPELLRLARTPSGLLRIERALREGRKATSHAGEVQAIEGRLEELGYRNPWRRELQALARALEIWMFVNRLSDLPFVLAHAVTFLDELGLPSGIPSAPDGFVRVGRAEPRGLERAFWEALARRAPVEEARAVLPAVRLETPPAFEWTRAPTIDDAADALAFSLRDPESRAARVVLVGDGPSARRSLERALERQGIPVDGTPFAREPRMEESVYAVLLPLRVVARGYAREDVFEWVRLYHPELYTAERIREALSRGIARGLHEYEDREGGRLFEWSEELRALAGRVGGLPGGRLSPAEAARAHLAEVARLPEPARASVARAAFLLQASWDELLRDLEATGEAGRPRPARKWWDLLDSILREGSPLREAALPQAGIRIHRLGHGRLDAEAEPGLRVTLFAPTVQDFSGGPGARGDLWWTGAERDAVGAEFELETSVTREAEARARILEWVEAAESFDVWDAERDERGKEREDLAPCLKGLPGVRLDARREVGAWAPRLPSHGLSLEAPPLELALAPLSEIGVNEVPATALDQLSRCEFAGTARARWKLRDEEDPGWEPWALSRGTILHEAAAILLRTPMPPERALEEALKKNRFQGLFRSSFARERAKRALVQALETFVLEEKEYAARSRAEPVWIEEGRNLRWESRSGLTVQGQPDRVDRHADGLFVIDYKTKAAGGLPTGKDLLEKGVALQTPFYALALARGTGKRVIGTQLVSLTQKGGRKKGIFFRRWNGGDPGMLTDVRYARNSANVFDIEPEEAWAKAEERIEEVLARHAAGLARVEPRLYGECRSCFARDLCGIRRSRTDEADEEGEE